MSIVPNEMDFTSSQLFKERKGKGRYNYCRGCDKDWMNV